MLNQLRLCLRPVLRKMEMRGKKVWSLIRKASSRQNIQRQHLLKCCLQVWLLCNYSKPFGILQCITAVSWNASISCKLYLWLQCSKHRHTKGYIQWPNNSLQQPQEDQFSALYLGMIDSYLGSLRSSELRWCGMKSPLLLNGHLIFYAVDCQIWCTTVLCLDKGMNFSGGA